VKELAKLDKAASGRLRGAWQNLYE